MFDNQVVVASCSGSDKFYRQPSGEYFNVDNRTATLDKTGYVNFYEVTKPYMPNLTKQELMVIRNQCLTSYVMNSLLRSFFIMEIS